MTLDHLREIALIQISQAQRTNAVTHRALGNELKVGDTIEVWWSPRRDTIIALKPYTGVYKDSTLKGAQIAEFALNPSGMTIEAGMLFTVLA